MSGVADQHEYTHTCAKYVETSIDGKLLLGADCRYGYGDDGKTIAPTVEEA